MILQVLVLVFVALIAYWWANQGAFSALLHLLCVIIAGALTLAFWEPISVALLPTLGDHTWSVVFLGLFAVSLLLFRILFDRFVPGNLNFPAWVNFTVGGALGAAAGILTVGMLILGMGFSQSVSSLLEFYGWTRLPEAQGQPDESQKLWVPVHSLTTGFYGVLSSGALSPHTNTALAKYYPDLDRTALSLHRDSWSDGWGKTSVTPSAISVSGLTFDPDYACADGSKGAYALSLSFQSTAFDRGQGLTLSAAQAKLVGQSTQRSGMQVNFPVEFTEDIEGGNRSTFPFDDIQNYATSARGQQSATVDLIFPATGLADVRFAMVKGLRFSLPPATQGSIASLAGASSGTTKVAHLSGDGAPALADSDLSLENSISPLQIGINQATGLDIVEDKKGNWVSGGLGDFPKKGAFNISRSQRISGFLCSPGTAVMRLDVTRGLATVDMGELKKTQSPGSPFLLVDSEDRGYAAAGYVWDMGNEVRVAYDPVQLMRTLKDFPTPSSGGTQRLWIVFVVPEGVTIQQVRAGETVLATTDRLVKGNI